MRSISQGGACSKDRRTPSHFLPRPHYLRAVALQFEKWEGTGNDFVLVDGRQEGRLPSDWSDAEVEALCDRGIDGWPRICEVVLSMVKVRRVAVVAAPPCRPRRRPTSGDRVNVVIIRQIVVVSKRMVGPISRAEVILWQREYTQERVGLSGGELKPQHFLVALPDAKSKWPLRRIIRIHVQRQPCGSAEQQLLDTRSATKRHQRGAQPVSYTHLTLPTKA